MISNYAPFWITVCTVAIIILSTGAWLAYAGHFNWLIIYVASIALIGFGFYHIILKGINIQ